MRLPGEVKPRLVLKLQAAHHSVRPPPRHDQRSHEADDLEIPGEFRRIPNLTVFGLKRLPAAGDRVDFDQAPSTGRFGWVAHVSVLSDPPLSGWTLTAGSP